jgi:hypothetical protein
MKRFCDYVFEQMDLRDSLVVAWAAGTARVVLLPCSLVSTVDGRGFHL